MENNNFVYSEDQLMARLRFFIGICLALTLFGIVFVVLYSLIFVTQPLNAISPIDQKFFELIVPIATFLTGTLSGIMLAGGDKEAKQKAMDAANKGWDKPPAPVTPAPTTGGTPSFSSGSSFGSASFTPSPVGNPSSFGSAGSFGGFPTTRPEPVLGFPTTPEPTPQVVSGFGGRPAPAPAVHPEI